MSERGRLAMLLAALLLLAPVAWQVALALPAFGFPTSAYGQTINALVPHMRRVSNMVAAVNFDVRGFDTIGEELMLLAATTGATVLLRGSRGENIGDRAARLPGRHLAGRADGTVLVCRAAAILLMLFGVYVVLHGTVTPGGGFQGGVIVASSLLLVYLGEGYPAWRRIARAPVLALVEGLGAFAFVVAAAVPLAWGRPALSNILPLGTWKDLFSGGTMVVVNAAVGFAVAGSFGLILGEFMEETRGPEDEDMPDEEHR